MTETSTVGGERLTVTKLFAVMPQMPPLSSSAVSTVTPVAKRDAASRNAAGLACCILSPGGEVEQRLRTCDGQTIHPIIPALSPALARPAPKGGRSRP